MKKPTKASGANIPEAQRSTVQVKLRLPVEVAEGLDALASRWRVNRSQCVARMVWATQHKSPANLRNDSERNEG